MRTDIRHRRQSGVAAVELGLLLVPLVTLVFGVAEYARAMYQYNAIAKATRTGARYLSQFQAGDAAAIGAAKCLVVHGNPGCQGPVITPGLALGMVEVADASNDASMKFQQVSANGVAVGVANLVRVRVNGYQFDSVVGFIAPAFAFDPISVTMTQAIP